MTDQTPKLPAQETDTPERPEARRRKPYRQPDVRDYGTIANLTQAVLTAGGADNGIYLSA